MKRLALCALVVAGCTARAQLPSVDPGLDALAIAEVHPALLLPGSELDVVGAGFVDASLGATRIELSGTFTPASGDATAIDLFVPAQFVDGSDLNAPADAKFFAALPAPAGHLDGEARVLVDSALDGNTHPTAALPISIDFAPSVTPSLQAVSGAGTIYVNDAILVEGDGFLLGGGEGDTHAIVSGCFTPAAGGACAPVADVDLTASPAAPWDRTQVAFAFSPAIAGILPGSFSGTVRIENHPAGGAAAVAGSKPLAVTLQKPAITTINPTAASLGQYVHVTGGGFVGAADDEVTLVHLVGTFSATGAPAAAPVDLEVVPHFTDGRDLRYVLDETDALGQLVDLRSVSGRFTGTATPIVRKGQLEVVGDAADVQLDIAPVKQVVWVRFLPSYVDSLRFYGLAAADSQIRARVMQVAARDYAGINIEFRTDEPQDFALYSTVDIVGPDPNGLGLFGYDNTPGKDVGNQRLFDKIGGVNAETQSDGSPGFGGVFTEEFLGFSAHPTAQVAPLQTASSFDAIFDAVRPDTGTPVTAAEVRGGVSASDGSLCPVSGNRPQQVACAVYVLGNLIGNTLTHEVGHSLGLADPDGDLFHDAGDAPNRLMDTGDARPFEERAEIIGQGPGVFCDDEFAYLTTILTGASTPDPGVMRPGCN